MEIFRESLAEENGPREAFTWLPLFWSGQRRGGGLRRVVSDLGRPPVGREGLSPFLSHLSPWRARSPMALEAARKQLQAALAHPDRRRRASPTADSSKEDRGLLASMRAARAAETEMVGAPSPLAPPPPQLAEANAKMGERASGRSPASLMGFTMVHLALWAQLGE